MSLIRKIIVCNEYSLINKKNIKTVALSNLRKSHVALSILRKCHVALLLRPKKGRVAVSILRVPKWGPSTDHVVQFPFGVGFTKGQQIQQK